MLSACTTENYCLNELVVLPQDGDFGFESALDTGRKK